MRIKPRAVFKDRIVAYAAHADLIILNKIAVQFGVVKHADGRISAFCVGVYGVNIDLFQTVGLALFYVNALPDAARHDARHDVPAVHMRRLADI